jgi:surface protein
VFKGNTGSWNVSNVTNIGGMFNGAGAFNRDISSWDVSQVTDKRCLLQISLRFRSAASRSGDPL